MRCCPQLDKAIISSAFSISSSIKSLLSASETEIYTLDESHFSTEPYLIFMQIHLVCRGDVISFGGSLFNQPQLTQRLQ